MSKFMDFLFENEDGTYTLDDIVAWISTSVNKLNASSAAIAKCEMMIANAIAKSEILIQINGEMVEDKNYFVFNIQPNPNQSGTEFWQQVVQTLLRKSECLVVNLGQSWYCASSFTANDNVFREKEYMDVVINSGTGSETVRKKLKASDVMHLRYRNAKVRGFLEKYEKQHDELADAVSAVVKLTATPKYKLLIQAQTSIVDSKTKQRLDIDTYISNLAEYLKSNDLSILKMPQGLDLTPIEVKSDKNVSDLKTITEEINKAAAKAYNIPITVFDGTVTEKSDADNEFMTYAVEPIVEVINDELTAKVIGLEGFLKGERIGIFTANHKHRDAIDAAAGMEKLRGIGFTLDEIRRMIGYMPLNTDFSTQRALTKNFTVEEEIQNDF